MIELPEAITLSRQLKEAIAGKTVEKVYPPSSPHKFCWFNGDVDKYGGFLEGRRAQTAEAFGIFAELVFEDGWRLAVNDGVNARFLAPGEARPAKYQLLLAFTDGSAIVFTVAMYGGIVCHDGSYDNEYYIKSRQGLSPLAEKFDQEYFQELLASVKPGMSLKAFLATEQRIPGLGNGVLQDILFQAGLQPSQKVGKISPAEGDRLYQAVREVLKEMTDRGGRDTEKDIYGNPGGYKTLMSKNTYRQGCPHCHGEITKKAYLGGSVYYCPVCQPLRA